jgi:hypothetical protein
VLSVATAPAAGADPVQAWEAISSGWDRSSSALVADVDGNGIPDIVVGHEDGMVRVYKDGGPTMAAGWPQPAKLRGDLPPTAIESSPAIADLDRNGGRQIVQGVGSTFVKNQHGGVVVFNSDGSTRCTWFGADNMNVWNMDPHPDGFTEGVFSTPAIGDINGDGLPEIVFGGWDSFIHALDGNCHELPGFPFFNDDTVWSSPSLKDIDGSGKATIFIGNDSHAGGSQNWPGGNVRALRYDNGAVRQLWIRKVAEVVHSSVAIGDITGTGRLAVVHGAGDFYHTGDSNKVFAWFADNGDPVPGWPKTTGGVVWSSPTLADLNGDGVPDVVVGSRDHKVWAWKGDGTQLWSVDPAVDPGAGETSMEVQGSAIVADINGDGKPEVVIGTAWGLFILDGATGNRVGPALDRFWSHEGAPAVGNFGPNGWRLFTHAFDTPNKKSRFAAYSIPAPGKTPEWPMWRMNAHRTGTDEGPPLPPGYCRKNTNPEPNPNPASSRGYWFLGRDGGVFSFPGDTPFYGSLPGLHINNQATTLAALPNGRGYYMLGVDGGVFSFGEAQFFGSMAGQRLNAPIIGMAVTPSGRGYWLLGADGGIFSFGDAQFFGSTGGMRLNAPVIAMAGNPNGRGYWLLAKDGGIFSFGDAPFFGSTGGMKLNAPVVSMGANPNGQGYWLLGGDGGVFSFGTDFFGSVPGTGLCARVVAPGVQIRPSTTGRGYWILAADGGVFSFGDAQFKGSFPGLPPGHEAIDMTVRR